MNCSKLFGFATLALALASTPSMAQENETEVSLWKGGYKKSNFEVVMGYVNKSWICTYDSGTQREDFFGDPDSKFIHGVQVGALYTPSFDWGLGLRTGVFLEGYQSRSKWITPWCDQFTEGDLYIPLHASFRIPFKDQISLNIYGGIGFQWAMQGRYENENGYRWTSKGRRPYYETIGYQEYGNGWPQKVNWQTEYGLNFYYKRFALTFIYSFGIIDQGIQNTFDDGETYVTANRSRQDKMQASLSFFF